jgi:FtsP/CotA-like multicopper oxidase with cupredoxin domain
MLSSRDGQLHVDLTAAPATYTINGHQFQGMLYNGSYMPPVWRLHAGDSLTVTLHNHLNEPTNLHFHGLDVSPLGNGDNVFLHIQPGSDFTYHITIPQKHVGLFGFHPHLHGDVDRQIIGGMSGGIIIEGSARLYPFLKKSHGASRSLKTSPDRASGLPGPRHGQWHSGADYPDSAR